MSAENAWRIAMQEAANAVYAFSLDDPPRRHVSKSAGWIPREATKDAIHSLPMPPAFRAEVEEGAEEAIRAEKEENRWAYVRAALEDNQTEADELRAALVQIAALVPAHIAGEIARKALSRLEAKGEP